MSASQSSEMEVNAVGPAAPGVFTGTDLEASNDRPKLLHFSSAPAYHSPLRHHVRHSSSPRLVKVTSNAQSRYSSSDQDGSAQRRINQYLIQEELGRGSFGAVHLATNQYGTEFAVKEFSKNRLRQRAKSHLLRRPRSKPSSPSSSSGARPQDTLNLRKALQNHNMRGVSGLNDENSFTLIREEIAVMKKLNHPNLVGLIEVLDDPEEDSLYMVLEMCKKGVVMRIDPENAAEPYSNEDCRYWFRDLILGIEYLHAQGVIHRDIKPDNCLLTEEDVLKVVDFGVSEMFEKSSEMKVTKAAGSPAFMAPELCVPRQDEVSGRATDIWSMGVTLYCLRFGRVPFQSAAVLELYKSIISDPVQIDEDCDESLRDLLKRMLEKDPARRIGMRELRAHPWVTCSGADPLLSEEENCADYIPHPTEAEMNAAITGNMGQIIAVMKAVHRFKSLLEKKQVPSMTSILGGTSGVVMPPLPIAQGKGYLHKSKSLNVEERRPVEGPLVTEGIHRAIPLTDGDSHPTGLHVHAFTDTDRTTLMQRTSTGGKGQAHDPLEDHISLAIGAGPTVNNSDEGEGYCESPGAVDHDVFTMAYKEHLKGILRQRDEAVCLAPMYLTRRVEDDKEIREQLGFNLNTPDIVAGPQPGLKSSLNRMNTPSA